MDHQVHENVFGLTDNKVLSFDHCVLYRPLIFYHLIKCAAQGVTDRK